MSGITPEVVEAHGLSPEEYERVLHALGREPNLVELGIFSVMWSEHCSYKSSRFHLKKLPTEAPWVIQGPGENAGVIDIGDGQAAIFKMESHNHPSYIEPYQGAATGVGGILRDVFTMGARPVANMNALRFGSPEHPKMKHLVQGVVAGIGGYGNCVGVPTVGGETNFHKAYDGNILVNAMTVGVAETDKIFYCAATGLGNPIVYVGSKTGRDGIHGATMASADFDENSDEKRPTVQVGDPFTEKLLIEACLELMATDAIVAIQDMGAAGLTSSSVEMASKGGAGIRLDMNKVPCREEAMTPYEMMLSESQERMLMVLKPGKEAMAEAIFRKWELDFAVIGEVTDTGHMVLEFDGEVVCDIPLGPLADDAPEYERPYVSPEEYKAWAKVPALGDVPESTDLGADLLKLMGGADLASRKWIWEQYDSQVGADTMQKSGGDAAVVRVHGTQKALAISTDCSATAMPTLTRAASRRSQRPTATSARSAACRWQSPIASTSRTRSARRSWRRSSAASTAWAMPAARSTIRSCPATSRSTTNRKPPAAARRSCRHRQSAAWACSSTTTRWLPSPSRTKATTSSCWAVRARTSASRCGCARLPARKRAKRRRSISMPNVPTAQPCVNGSARTRSPPSMTSATAACWSRLPKWPSPAVRVASSTTRFPLPKLSVKIRAATS